MTLIKYTLLALSFKLLSVSPRLYRFLANLFGAKGRVSRGITSIHVSRAKRIIELCERYSVGEGYQLLELGTGWLHWESIIIRLFYNVKIYLFDVWDNRQLAPLKIYLKQFSEIIDDEIIMEPQTSNRVHGLINTIISVNSFEELYKLMNFEYIIEPKGTLQYFQDASIDFIYSNDVLEHINKNIAAKYIRDIYRLLKPGGYSIHRIDISDHITYKVIGASKKQYLIFSDAKWNLFFENKVRYFNRIQKSEWMDLFQATGFKIEEEVSSFEDIGELRIDNTYDSFDQHDLACITLDVVLRRPQKS